MIYLSIQPSANLVQFGDLFGEYIQHYFEYSSLQTENVNTMIPHLPLMQASLMGTS